MCPGSSEPSPLALEGGRPQSRQAPPGGHLGQNLCFLLPPDGSGMASGRVHLPAARLPGTGVDGVGTSGVLPQTNTAQCLPSTPGLPQPLSRWDRNWDPLAAYKGVQQKLEEREVGEGLGVSFLSFFLLPYPQHT